MLARCFTNGTIVGAGGGDRLCVEAGRIAAPSPELMTESHDLEGGFLLPGFVDTQVNGGGGVLFNASPTVEAIAAIGAAHAKFGTTAFLPTFISDDLDRVDAAMRAVEAAIEMRIPGVVGIHIEGPFLSAARAGTHDSGKFRRLDRAALALFSSLGVGKTVVTLAPEECDGGDIATLVEAGVIVSAGHTNATYAQMTRAFAAGITGVTHLFNAMAPFHHRAPGVVGAALEADAIYCGLIADGHHVDDAAIRIALKAHALDKFMLVTDAMACVGAQDQSFSLQGKTIRVVDGVCLDEAGILSGSNLDMATALRNIMAMAPLSIAEASVMASAAPAAFLGLQDRGRLELGARADLVWLSSDLQLRGVWMGGARVA